MAVHFVQCVRKLEDHAMIHDLDGVISGCVGQADREPHRAHLLVLVVLRSTSVQVGRVDTATNAGASLDDLPVRNTN